MVLQLVLLSLYFLYLQPHLYLFLLEYFVISSLVLLESIFHLTILNIDINKVIISAVTIKIIIIFFHLSFLFIHIIYSFISGLKFSIASTNFGCSITKCIVGLELFEIIT